MTRRITSAEAALIADAAHKGAMRAMFAGRAPKAQDPARAWLPFRQRWGLPECIYPLYVDAWIAAYRLYSCTDPFDPRNFYTPGVQCRCAACRK